MTEQNHVPGTSPLHFYPLRWTLLTLIDISDFGPLAPHIKLIAPEIRNLKIFSAPLAIAPHLACQPDAVDFPPNGEHRDSNGSQISPH